MRAGSGDVASPGSSTAALHSETPDLHVRKWRGALQRDSEAVQYISGTEFRNSVSGTDVYPKGSIVLERIQ